VAWAARRAGWAPIKHAALSERPDDDLFYNDSVL